MNSPGALEALLGEDPPSPAGEDGVAIAIANAALKQFELFGIARSTIEDISRRAGVARVTVYRRFASKDALVREVLLRELTRFLTGLDRVIEPLPDSESRLVTGFLYTLESSRSHRLLQRMLETEPETLLPYLTVQGGPFIGAARDFLAQRLAGDSDDRRADRRLLVIAELVVRLILSFLLTPEGSVDLNDPDQARAFALDHLGPLLGGAGNLEAS